MFCLGIVEAVISTISSRNSTMQCDLIAMYTGKHRTFATLKRNWEMDLGHQMYLTLKINSIRIFKNYNIKRFANEQFLERLP